MPSTTLNAEARYGYGGKQFIARITGRNARGVPRAGGGQGPGGGAHDQGDELFSGPYMSVADLGAAIDSTEDGED